MRRPAAWLAVALLAAACGAPAPTPGPASAPLATAPASVGAVPTPAASAPTSSDAPVSGAPSDPVAVEDPSLLDALPETIDGQPVTLESIAFTEALADPAFANSVEAAAFGVVVSGQDLASAVVARPNEGVYTEAWFRDWRDSYDRGACSQAGGLAATAETEVDGRTLYVGTCVGGLHTYHMWLPRREALVSAFGLGENRFGEQLMAGIRP